MEAFGLLAHGFAVLLTWKTLALMMVGLVLGIFVGVLPGLGGPNGVAILLPLTFTMDPTSAIVMLSCIYWGALFGGAITSILFNIPGEAWSVATTFDGYPMAQQGKAAEALTAAFTSSFIGSLFAVLLITFLAPGIASFALRFGPPEFFAVYLLTFCSFVGLGREAKHKTIISMALGLLLAGVGMDTVSGQLRMTFGLSELLRGINFLVAVIGLFGISEILLTMEERLALRGHAARISLRVLLNVWKDLPRYWVTLLRSSVIGAWLGITPGGAIAASFMGYNLAKRFSKDPESFGKGRIEGVFAPETAAHASGTAALLPMLALGIPGSGTAAILLGGLMVWGLNPGPLLFVEHKDFVWGLIASMYLGNIVGSGDCAHHRAGFCRRSARAVRGDRADDRGVVCDRRLRHPECHVRYLADAGLWLRRLRVQENRHSAGAVHAGAGAWQPRRRRIPFVDDRVGRRPSGVLVERAGRIHHHFGHRAAVLAGHRQGHWAYRRAHATRQTHRLISRLIPRVPAGPRCCGGRGADRRTVGMASRATIGITSRLQIGDSSMPPTITQASGCCTCEPMPVEIAAGTRPMQADKPVMKICRMRVWAASMMASSLAKALVQVAADVGDQQDTVHRRDAEQRDESDGRRHAGVQPEQIESENAAADRERNARQREQAVAHGIEQAVEQHHDQQQAERHDDREPLLGFHQRAELARPFHAGSLPATGRFWRYAPAPPRRSSRGRGRARCI